jgi:hypothetical protein
MQGMSFIDEEKLNLCGNAIPTETLRLARDRARAAGH